MVVQSPGQELFAGAQLMIRNEACGRDVCHTYGMVTSFYNLLAAVTYLSPEGSPA